MVAKDFLGRQLKVGDKVVYLSTKSKDLKAGYIGALNEKTARVYNAPRNDSDECRVGKDYYIVYYRNIVKVETATPIPVNDLEKYAAKPILIYQKNNVRWSEWWDIVDSVNEKFIRTAYCEDLYFSDYGQNWFAFDYSVSREAVAEIFWKAFVSNSKEDDSDGE